MFVSIKKMTTLGSRKLKDYFAFDKQMENLKEKLEQEETGKDVNSFIKSKNKISSTVENKVIRKIMLENKINELILWKGIVEEVINGYKKFQEHKYKVEIAYQISIIALSKNLITIDDIIDERL